MDFDAAFLDGDSLRSLTLGSKVSVSDSTDLVSPPYAQHSSAADHAPDHASETEHITAPVDLYEPHGLLSHGALPTSSAAGGEAADDRTPPQAAQLLLLVGLPGSGKSTFASQLLGRAPPGSWVRVNQDELGSRRACEAAARAALRLGKSVIVDRCNFDVAQRTVWVTLAAELQPVPPVLVRAVYFDVAPRECERRACARRSHATITRHNAARVISSMAQALQPPVGRGEFSSSGPASSRGGGGDEGIVEVLVICSGSAAMTNRVLDAVLLPLPSTASQQLGSSSGTRSLRVTLRQTTLGVNVGADATPSPLT